MQGFQGKEQVREGSAKLIKKAWNWSLADALTGTGTSRRHRCGEIRSFPCAIREEVTACRPKRSEGDEGDPIADPFPVATAGKQLCAEFHVCLARRRACERRLWVQRGSQPVGRGTKWKSWVCGVWRHLFHACLSVSVLFAGEWGVYIATAKPCGRSRQNARVGLHLCGERGSRTIRSERRRNGLQNVR